VIQKCRRLVCFICSLLILFLNTSIFAAQEQPVDKPNAGLAAVYGYVLNDYINLMGVVSDEHPAGFMENDTPYPNGIVYADIINFDNNDYPYLVIFTSDAKRGCASCHIWSYSSKYDRAEKIGEIVKRYAPLTKTRGAFALGWLGERRYITYKEFDETETHKSECYTVINGEAFQYVEGPGAVNEAAVMNFTASTFFSDVNISGYNQALTDFFNKLKDTSAACVTYSDVTDNISREDMSALEASSLTAAALGNFDIFDYASMEEYESALSQRNGAVFYSVSSVHDLGDEMYYVRFATDQSFYNYALMRRTDRSERYQILKVRLDCIPLSDRELSALKRDYTKSNLLYKKASVSYAAPEREQSTKLFGLPKLFSFPRLIDSGISRIAVFAVAALTVLLVTGLWVFMYEDSDNK